MLSLNRLYHDKESNSWKLFLDSDFAYEVFLDVPEKWALEAIASGKFKIKREEYNFVIYVLKTA